MGVSLEGVVHTQHPLPSARGGVAVPVMAQARPVMMMMNLLHCISRHAPPGAPVMAQWETCRWVWVMSVM